MKSSYYSKEKPQNITQEWLDAHNAATAKLCNDVSKTFKSWRSNQRKMLGYQSQNDSEK